MPVAKMTMLHDVLKDTKAHFSYAVNNGKDLEKLAEGWTLQKEANYLEAAKRYAWWAWIADIPFS